MNTSFFDTVLQSWKFLFRHWKQCLPLYGMDMLFFLALSFVSVIIMERMAEHLVALTTIAGMMGEQLQELQGEALQAVMLYQEQFQMQYRAVLQYLFLFLVAVFLLWVVLQGYNWKKTYSLLGMNIPVKQFYGRFFALNGLCSVVALLVSIVLIQFSTPKISGMRLLTEGIAMVLAALVFLFLAYLLFVGYGMMNIPIKQSIQKLFPHAFKNLARSFPAFLLVLLLSGIILKLMQLASSQSAFLVVLLLLFGLLPVMAWARVFLIQIIHGKHHTG